MLCWTDSQWVYPPSSNYASNRWFRVSSYVGTGYVHSSLVGRPDQRRPLLTVPPARLPAPVPSWRRGPGAGACRYRSVDEVSAIWRAWAAMVIASWS